MLSSLLKTLGLIGPTISLFDLGRTAPRTKRASSLNYRFTDRTTDARHWHNPADPVQAARIEAAAAKRGKRARKLHNHVVDSVLPNRAHGAFLPDEDGEIRFSVVPRLNPFYIAK